MADDEKLSKEQEELKREQEEQGEEEEEEGEEEDDDEEDEDEDEEFVERVPITVITGFLGAGKTTLVNHILKDPTHGLKFAVIENEFGDVGVDDAIIKKKSDEIIEVLNGCVCCTVRTDLSKTVKKLLARKEAFDAIIIETTGMADPSPVAQTFIVDEEIAPLCVLDGIVTVVDAKHVLQHLNDDKNKKSTQEDVTNESVQQIAFADRILLNKVDLVTKEELEDVKQQIQEINSSAQIFETQRSVIDPKLLIGMRSFSLDRVLEFEPEFLDDKEKASKEKESKDGEHGHGHSHGDSCGESNCNHDHGHNHSHGHGHGHSHDHSGSCSDPHCSSSKKKHNHDRAVGSLSFRFEGDIALPKLDAWIQDLLKDKPENLYRYKGVISVAGMSERYVFQGVHQLFEGDFQDPWEPNEIRVSKFVFIGKNLDREAIEKGFNACKAHKLRFAVDDHVEVNAGEIDFIPAKVISLWNDGYPYRVRPDDEEEDDMWVPEDTDEFIRTLSSKKQRTE